MKFIKPHELSPLSYESKSKVMDDAVVPDQDEANDSDLYYPDFLYTDSSDWLDSIEPSIDHLIGSSSDGHDGNVTE